MSGEPVPSTAPAPVRKVPDNKKLTDFCFQLMDASNIILMFGSN